MDIDKRVCLCGCFAETKGGTFLPGHDAKLFSALRLELALAWGAHIERTTAVIDDFEAFMEESRNPEFQKAVDKALARVKMTHSKGLIAKVEKWIASHRNWDEYFTGQH